MDLAGPSTIARSCERCRKRRQRCDFTNSLGVQCDRCERQGVECSGPNAVLRKPCASCVRVRRKCEWVDGSDVCLRCQSYGGTICPRPPKTSRALRRIGSTSSPLIKEHPTPIQPVLSQHQAFHSVISRATRQELARQGERCLMAVGLHGTPDCIRGRMMEDSAWVLDDISYTLNLLSGLKLINVSPATSPKHPIGPSVHRMDELVVAEASQIGPQRASLQRDAVPLLTTRLWSLIRQSTKSCPGMSPEQTLQLTHSLVSAVNLHAASIETEDRGLFLSIGAYVLVLGATILTDCRVSSAELRRELRYHMCSLARFEAVGALKSGLQSLVPPRVVEILHPQRSTGSLHALAPHCYNIDPFDPDPEGIHATCDLKSFIFDDLLSPTMRTLLEVTHQITAEPSSDLHNLPWTRLNAASGDLDGLFCAMSATLSDLPKTAQARAMLRWIFGLELWSVQLRVLMAKRLEEQVKPELPLEQAEGIAMNQALSLVCERLEVVYSPQDDVASDVFQIFDDITHVLHLCLTSKTVTPILYALPQEHLDRLRDCMRVANVWDDYAGRILLQLEGTTK